MEVLRPIAMVLSVVLALGAVAVVIFLLSYFPYLIRHQIFPETSKIKRHCRFCNREMMLEMTLAGVVWRLFWFYPIILLPIVFLYFILTEEREFMSGLFIYLAGSYVVLFLSRYFGIYEAIIGTGSYKCPMCGLLWSYIGGGRVKAFSIHAQEVEDSTVPQDQNLKVDGSPYQEYIKRGKIYAYNRQYDQAIAEYTKALEINPRSIESYNKRGIAYFQAKNQYDKAILDFDKALEINPNYATAYYNKALAYVKAGRNHDAVGAYESFIQYASPADDSYIKIAKERIRELEGKQTQEEKIEAPQEEKDECKCPNCGKNIGKEQKSCSACGIDIDWSEFECPECRNDIKRGQKYCTNCGAKLDWKGWK